MMKKTHKLVSLLLAVVLVLGMVPMVSAQNTTTFTDVNSTDWFYADVMAMAEKGIINGYTDGSYRPNDPVTYAEFSSLVSKAFYGSDLEKEVRGEGFVDVDMKPRMTTAKADQWWAHNMAVMGYNDLWTESSLPLVGNYEYDTVMDMNNMLDYDALWTSVQSVADGPMSRQAVMASLGQMFALPAMQKPSWLLSILSCNPLMETQMRCLETSMTSMMAKLVTVCSLTGISATVKAGKQSLCWKLALSRATPMAL